ncbi:hypothetical protein VTN96DRAFT_228 [Rasamsonia emersonii]
MWLESYTSRRHVTDSPSPGHGETRLAPGKEHAGCRATALFCSPQARFSQHTRPSLASPGRGDAQRPLLPPFPKAVESIESRSSRLRSTCAHIVLTTPSNSLNICRILLFSTFSLPLSPF